MRELREKKMKDLVNTGTGDLVMLENNDLVTIEKNELQIKKILRKEKFDRNGNLKEKETVMIFK